MKLNSSAVIFSTIMFSAAAIFSSTATAGLTFNVVQSGGVLIATGTCTPGGGTVTLSGRRMSGTNGPTGWMLLKSDPTPACLNTGLLTKHCSDAQWGTGVYKFKLKQGTGAAITTGNIICP